MNIDRKASNPGYTMMVCDWTEKYLILVDEEGEITIINAMKNYMTKFQKGFTRSVLVGSYAS